MNRQVLRHRVWTAYQQWDGASGRLQVPCAWCGREITAAQGFDVHEYLVKRSAAPKAQQHLIMVVENCVPVHPSCHMQHGQTKAFALTSLAYACGTLGPERIARWYVSLWEQQNLAVPRGRIPCGEEWEAYLVGVIG